MLSLRQTRLVDLLVGSNIARILMACCVTDIMLDLLYALSFSLLTANLQVITEVKLPVLGHIVLIEELKFQFRVYRISFHSEPHTQF